ncbi:hypothetical protein PSTG_01128 [Puccinia striiformis f. sp. tritici PST-78]|uniref:Core-binding (CB) domain-containing protein n=1 Tax=Puccinia striiformis f. sp. tritici PST-78 TaxID=1165861 RepID=A0A0L0W2G1_9BASI|nr:hypothetical protein PSTG_01128 [Puccinia striiformis f. sp. tritici PST-78]
MYWPTVVTGIAHHNGATGCVGRPDVLGIHTGIIRKYSPDANPHANQDPVGRRCLHKFWHWSSCRQQVESIADERDMARWGEPKRNCLVGNGGNPHRVDHGHNCAVKKYLNFSAEKHPGKLKLPISSSDVEAFGMWAARNEYVTHAKKIDATSLRKYLIGLKAWHTFHAVQFPDSNKDRLNLLIKASAKADKLKMIVQKKPAVIPWHLVFLFNTLSKGTNFDRALADLVLVTFWGMAR